MGSTPKWMVDFMENPTKTDDEWGYSYDFFETSIEIKKPVARGGWHHRGETILGQLIHGQSARYSLQQKWEILGWLVSRSSHRKRKLFWISESAHLRLPENSGGHIVFSSQENGIWNREETPYFSENQQKHMGCSWIFSKHTSNSYSTKYWIYNFQAQPSQTPSAMSSPFPMCFIAILKWPSKKSRFCWLYKHLCISCKRLVGTGRCPPVTFVASKSTLRLHVCIYIYIHI